MDSAQKERAREQKTAVMVKTASAIDKQHQASPAAIRLATGTPGLDEVLCGGLIPGRAYLFRGGPGTGKTILGLQFLAAGVVVGERCLCISLGESETEIRQNAQSMGLNLENIHLLDLSPDATFFARMESYDIFSSTDVEHDPMMRQIIEQFESFRPQRVFLDDMTQFRFLTSDIFQFRKQVLSFLRFISEQGATICFTSEESAANPDDDLQFMSDGVLHLDATPDRRSLRVTKFRGSDFRSGSHGIRLSDQGLHVFPRLLPRQDQQALIEGTLSSGVPELDELLYGGLERSTITILTGPSGVGKTTLGLQFMKEAAGRGERSAIYVFEEYKEMLLRQCEAVNLPVHAMMEQGALHVVQIEPLHFSPEEFARMVQRDVEIHQTRIVMLDSVAGYRLSIRGDDLVSHLHALCKYLQGMGVTVLLVNEVESITGEFRVTEVGISYLADTIIFLRYLELHGEMRKAIGVLKKRLSDFERILREFEITRYGIKVGKPLTALRGVLTGHVESNAYDDKR